MTSFLNRVGLRDSDKISRDLPFRNREVKMFTDNDVALTPNPKLPMTVIMTPNTLKKMTRRPNKVQMGPFILLALSLFLGSTVVAAETKIITVPITIDYSLLRTLTIHSAFTDPNQTARLLESEDGCTAVTISDPRWREINGLLRLETFVDLKAGKSFGESCLMPVAWQGFLVLDQTPKINPENWQLSFKPVDSFVYDRQRQPVTLAGIVTKLMEQWVYPYLAGIRIDLAPPVTDLKQTLLPMFPEEHNQRTQIILDSMRPGGTQVKSDRVCINIHIDAPFSVDEDANSQGLAAALSQEEITRFIKVWETWDAFLVHMILALTEKPLTDEQKQTLLDTLLDTRHRFSAELAEDRVRGDFVKEQFVQVWEQLAPIFRQHLTDNSSAQSLAYLSFFTASDALTALNALGPALGLEISREGLIRLARLLGELPPDALSYPLDLDRRLRDILGFDPEGEESRPDVQPLPDDSKHPDTGMNKIPGRWHSVAFILGPRPVFAAGKEIKMSRLKPWIVPKTDLDNYLGRVRSLLKQTADNVVDKNGRLKTRRTLYEHIVYATAWQESCFRQFHTKNRQLVYLRSYNGSSVGLMQINERVWRGIYDINRLRWDIHYNARAGCEILATYFQRYALKKPDRIKSLKQIQLAGVVYAMYNGGPGEFKKFLSRIKTGKYYLSDRLFKDKFTWVIDNQWAPINQCLVVG